MTEAYTQADYDADLQCWSDMHKDVYGCRPNGVPTPTLAEMPAVMADLDRMMEIEIRMDRQRAIIAQYNFERSIEYHMRREALDRIGATRYVVNSKSDYDMYGHDGGPSDCNDRSDQIDFEHLCYNLGVPFELEGQIRMQYTGELG